jgi:inner membrane protein
MYQPFICTTCTVAWWKWIAKKHLTNNNYNMETIVQKVWDKSKILIKALIIGVLALLLMIPTLFVQNLVQEREQRQKEAITEVSSKWSGKQNISGPVLVLPYVQRASDSSKAITRHYAFFLPDELNIISNVVPQERSRGIYKVILYHTQTSISGSFKNIAVDKLKLAPESILWNEAFVKMNISDPKGLNGELKLKWNDSLVSFTPQNFEGPNTGEGLIANVPIAGNSINNIRFSCQLGLNGSGQILFTPIGKTTNVTLNGQWPHPSFTGSILPQTPVINKDGFKASWKSFSHKRSFPQYWKDVPFVTDSNDVQAGINTFNLSSDAFGADLFIPVNGYQKTMRSVKYAILCILLTFSAFFLMDVMYKKSVHPFQYGLIGLALVLFYVLLLSFSEYIGFDFAYIIASLATIGLIGWFVNGLLHSGRLGILLSSVLVFVYAYVFTILQLQDYSLLIGSIGLFITLAVIMYFSKKIQW